VDTSHPDRTRTAYETHQNGFCLIVSGVADSHALGRERCSGTTEKLVSQPPAGLFERRSLNPRDAGDIGRIDDHRQGDRRCQRTYKCFVLIRGRPTQPMIEMSDGCNRDLALLLQFAQHAQKGYGI
jgi:hypothetical protein